MPKWYQWAKAAKWSDKSKVNRGSQESGVRSQQELPELHFLRQTREFMSDYL
ncbi:hypothetical protein H6G48_12815 [Microcystis flos-aquae FACHB-1344]|uniref:Mobile element protein n=1 Tax=Microcystis flos-aquae FACHB-1344 TaxID=2692899 RepID=A0ABR8HVG3_9CHRO|nr:hypothetical protein [Microcystis flos-aquae]MBD2622509.1 hypothetical protein [Microcystis flos-aquae FACHB-1344]